MERHPVNVDTYRAVFGDPSAPVTPGQIAHVLAPLVERLHTAAHDHGLVVIAMAADDLDKIRAACEAASLAEDVRTTRRGHR